MAKPILVINYCIEGLSRNMAVTNLRDLQRVISESSANDDYYVFLLPVRVDSNIQVFYEKDFEEANYLELKKIIEDKFDAFSEKEDCIFYDEEEQECDGEGEPIEDTKWIAFWRKIGVLPRKGFQG